MLQYIPGCRTRHGTGLVSVLDPAGEEFKLTGVGCEFGQLEDIKCLHAVPALFHYCHHHQSQFLSHF